MHDIFAMNRLHPNDTSAHVGGARTLGSCVPTTRRTRQARVMMMMMMIGIYICWKGEPCGKRVALFGRVNERTCAALQCFNLGQCDFASSSK